MLKNVIGWFKDQTRGEKTRLVSGKVSPSDMKNVSLVNESSSNTKIVKNKIKSKLITLNARGVEYKIPLDQLSRLPDSRLGKIKTLIEKPNSLTETMDDLCDKNDLKTNTFYFNKDPFTLNNILNYFNDEKLHIEATSCGNLISEELEYWQIGDEILSDCCREKFYQEIDSINEKIREEEEFVRKYNIKHNFGESCFPKARATVWQTIEYKETWLAKVRCCVKYFK